MSTLKDSIAQITITKDDQSIVGGGTCLTWDGIHLQSSYSEVGNGQHFDNLLDFCALTNLGSLGYNPNAVGDFDQRLHGIVDPSEGVLELLEQEGEISNLESRYCVVSIVLLFVVTDTENHIASGSLLNDYDHLGRARPLNPYG